MRKEKKAHFDRKDTKKIRNLYKKFVNYNKKFVNHNKN